jgi:hypothetical protein
MSKVIVVIAAILSVSFSASASYATATFSNAEYLKKSRQEMETQTEQRILEMLESQRLEEERGRMRKVETMSFSVVAPETTVYQQ